MWPQKRRISTIAWGGGTPTSLAVTCFDRIMAEIARHFEIEPGAELSIEIDPRHFPVSYPQALRTWHYTRASLGVQDLNPLVQAAIGREQSLAQTRHCMDLLRKDAQVKSINIDLVYGLPKQTTLSVTQTVQAVCDLAPDRIAVFGYAHVPWKQPRQRLIDPRTLPDDGARFRQRERIDRILRAEGYCPVGMDHYARPSDLMVHGKRFRNFQGYNTDDAETLIGVGASAISVFPQGIVQNHASISAYARAMSDGQALPVKHGLQRSFHDLQRWAIIERLMCDLRADLMHLTGVGWCGFGAEHQMLLGMQADGLVRIEGAIVHVTEMGRPFLRAIAAVFDEVRAVQLAGQETGHARAV